MRIFQKRHRSRWWCTISPVFLVSRETNQSFPLVHLVLNFVAGCGFFRLATDYCANKRQPDPYHGTIKSPTWKIKHFFSALFFFFSAIGGPDKVEEASCSSLFVLILNFYYLRSIQLGRKHRLPVHRSSGPFLRPNRLDTKSFPTDKISLTGEKDK